MIASASQIVSGIISTAVFLGTPAYEPLSYSYRSSGSAIYSYRSISLNEEQQKCYAELDELATYKADWNGNGAAPFSPKLIDVCKNLINELRYQPEIYPTAIDAIQFEYRKDNGAYLEFEIYLDKANLFCINSKKQHITKTIKLDDVKNEVDAFYDAE